MAAHGASPWCTLCRLCCRVVSGLAVWFRFHLLRVHVAPRHLLKFLWRQVAGLARVRTLTRGILIRQNRLTQTPKPNPGKKHPEHVLRPVHPGLEEVCLLEFDLAGVERWPVAAHGASPWCRLCCRVASGLAVWFWQRGPAICCCGPVRGGRGMWLAGKGGVREWKMHMRNRV